MIRNAGKYTKKALLLVGCFALMIAVIVCAVITDSRKSKYATMNIPTGERNITLHEIGEVCLVNEVIADWLDNPGDVSQVEKLYEQYREYGRLDYPIPVNIEFSVNNIPSDIQIVKQEISISEKEDFSESHIYDVPKYHNSANIYNLKTGITYYYCVTVLFSDGQKIQRSSTFKTANTPRYIYIDGARNVRDIGGKQTSDGKTIRQGMVYRGTELDGVISEGKFVITEQGIDTMLNELNIKHHMDLRASNLENARDMLPGISHNYYTAFSYSETFDTHGVKSLKKIFTDLADINNYPMYISCTYGNDRTGTIVYLMGAVLGLDEQSLYTEWALSTFFSGGSFSEEMTEFVNIIQSYEGENLKDKVTNYLLSIGVTTEELDSFRHIMLDEE